MAEDTKKETEEKEKKHTLHLQRSKDRKEGMIYAHVTHLGFPVHGGLLEVPVDGRLEVDQDTYDAVMKHKLAEGYSWAGAVGRKVTPDSGSGSASAPKASAATPTKHAPTATSTTDTAAAAATATPAPAATSK